MDSNFIKRAGISIAAVSGIVLAAALFPPSHAKADAWDKMTLLTTNEPIQVSNTYLEPGTYMFKLANSPSDRHEVQIFNRDRSHLYATILAIPNYRTKVTSDPQFTFWETPPGAAKALRAWFYPGDNFGQEFAYPTQLRQVALVTQSAAALVPPPPPPPPPVVTEPQLAEPQAEGSPAPEAALEPAPQAEDQEQQQEQVLIAQNTPPPATPEPPPAPATPAPEANANADTNANALPRTASPYPTIGLCGLLALGLYFGLKMKQLS